ncbi:MAG: hypothetical protein SF028_03055 [Candidatus Sumerlaeia bacterium]|nr:hypothetical protein [Candidatus Sumerlaeia bacterium]
MKPILAALALGALAITGCVRLAKPPIETKHYLLEARREGPPREGLPADTVNLRVASVSPGYEGQLFVIRDKDGSYRSDLGHRFLAPPKDLVEEQAKAWMGSAGFQRAVEGSKTRSTHLPYLLDIHLIRLLGDFQREPAAEVELQAVLSAWVVDDSPRRVWTLRQRVPIDRRDPALLAEGWSQALEQAFAELEVGVSEALAEARRRE